LEGGATEILVYLPSHHETKKFSDAVGEVLKKYNTWCWYISFIYNLPADGNKEDDSKGTFVFLIRLGEAKCLTY